MPLEFRCCEAANGSIGYKLAGGETPRPTQFAHSSASASPPQPFFASVLRANLDKAIPSTDVTSADFHVRFPDRSKNLLDNSCEKPNTVRTERGASGEASVGAVGVSQVVEVPNVGS